MELGRDADTGGQTTYVVELARALVEHPEVERVDLVTRLISELKWEPVYDSEAGLKQTAEWYQEEGWI